MIASRLEEARQKLEEAEDKARDYQDKLDRLQERKKTWLEEAREETEIHRKELLQAAREEVEKAQQKWMESVKSDRNLFLDDLEKRSFDKLVETVEKIVRELANQDLEQHTLNRFMEELKAADAGDKENMSRSAKGGKVQIITAFVLSEPDQKELDKLVQKVLSEDVTCQFKTDSTLGFGIELRSNGWKMAWNMKAYIEELRSGLEGLFKQVQDQDM